MYLKARFAWVYKTKDRVCTGIHHTAVRRWHSGDGRDRILSIECFVRPDLFAFSHTKKKRKVYLFINVKAALYDLWNY